MPSTAFQKRFTGERRWGGSCSRPGSTDLRIVLFLPRNVTVHPGVATLVVIALNRNCTALSLLHVLRFSYAGLRQSTVTCIHGGILMATLTLTVRVMFTYALHP